MLFCLVLALWVLLLLELCVTLQSHFPFLSNFLITMKSKQIDLYPFWTAFSSQNMLPSLINLTHSDLLLYCTTSLVQDVYSFSLLCQNQLGIRKICFTHSFHKFPSMAIVPVLWVCGNYLMVTVCGRGSLLTLGWPENEENKKTTDHPAKVFIS